MAEKVKRLENILIPDKIDFLKIKSLSTESRIKLNRIKPKNIGQAARISGVAPSDINILLIYIGR
jgi:tRNA uridine 5-carboxymethylaminomethyl modification enzyme